MLSNYLAYEWVVIAAYFTGFAILAPPLAWGGLVAGWWMNRHNPLASRLAGALLAGTVGAYLALSWNAATSSNSGADIAALLPTLGQQLAMPFMFLSPWTLRGAVIFAQFYSPMLTLFLLCVLTSRYEEGISGAVTSFRERLSERRTTRVAARRDRVMSALPAGPAEPPALTPMRFASDDAAIDAPVVRARPGEAVALPAGMLGNGEARPVLIVVKVQAPAAAPVVLRHGGRGYIVGTCIAAYYLAAAASKLWLPLLVLGLWFFGPALLAYEQHQLAAALSEAARALKPW